VTAEVLDMGAPKSFDAALPERVRGAAVLVDPQKVGDDPSFVMRSKLAKRLAEAGAAAMLLPSDKPGRMVYTSAFGSTRRGRSRSCPSPPRTPRCSAACYGAARDP
jgi:hypothetical protein